MGEARGATPPPHFSQAPTIVILVYQSFGLSPSSPLPSYSFALYIRGRGEEGLVSPLQKKYVWLTRLFGEKRCAEVVLVCLGRKMVGGDTFAGGSSGGKGGGDGEQQERGGIWQVFISIKMNFERNDLICNCELLSLSLLSQFS